MATAWKKRRLQTMGLIEGRSRVWRIADPTFAIWVRWRTDSGGEQP